MNVAALDICPAIMAKTPDEFRVQLERVRFARRLHLDVSDGKLTAVKLLDIADLWWPGGVRADIHVMYQRPFDHAALLLNLRPQLVIVHAEAEGDFVAFAEKAHSQGVEVGVALQPQTPASVLRPALGLIDHVMIFSGNLGHFGGEVDLSLLDKVRQLNEMKPQLEIGWDGGVNPVNIKQLAEGGVQVLNSGGFIQNSQDANSAYQKLVDALAE